MYDGDGVLFPSNQDFTLSGSAQNFNTPEFQFLSGGAEIHPFATTSEVIISSSGYPQRGDTSLFEVRVREQGGSDIGVFDNIDVFAVQSGSDAFTVFLTNEAHVFSATSESVVSASDLEAGEFEVRFFRGAEQYNSGSSGKTYSVTASVQTGIVLSQSLESSQAKFRPTSLSADNGKATIIVTDNNTSQTFNKEYTFSKSKEGLVGERGPDGANGASGSNAKVVSLSSTKYAVVYDGDGVLFPTDQNFNLSGSSQNFTNPEFQFLSASAVLHDFASTSEVTISSSGYPEAGNATLYEVRVRENGGSYEGVFDNIDVFGVQSGSDSFTTFLTNEAHVFSANSDGVVTSTLSDGSFETRFFRGAEQYNFGTSGKSYSVSATSSSIELTQSTNSNQRKFTPSSVSADSGTASIILTDNNTGQTFPKTYTFSKSKKGAPVTTIAASPQSQTITSGSGGIGAPTDITITVNEGGSDYGYDTAGAIPANKFRITGVTNATNNNDGTITPDTPTSSTPVTGVATISYTNSEGTAFTSKTIPFDVGVAGLGNTGGQGDAGLRTSANMVHYQITGSTQPSKPTATSYTFATNTFAGLTSNWGTGAPTYASGNQNKYWYSTFTVVETTAGGGTGVPVFSDAVQAIGFSGLVSFTATDTIGDGTDNLSFGVAGSTLINGDNISTGRILSTNYATGSGDGFTATGTEFNLDEGLIASKKFNVKPNGDANFKGDITGASGTFSGTVQIGGTSLDANNTLNENTSASDVGLNNVLNQAQTTTFRQNSVPTATASGDIWIDTNDNNKMYVATGAGDNQVTSGEWELSNVNKSAIGLSNVDNQSASTIQAGTTADNVGLGNLDNTNFDSSGNVIGGTIGGITIASTKLYQGTGTWANSNTGFYLDNGANFSLQDKLAFNGSTGDLAISGSIFAESGTFSGDVAGATISVPATTPKFTVASDGTMTAIDAEFSGSISSTSGDIGGWGIATSRIFSPTSGQERMQLTGGTAPNLTVLDSSGSPNVVINSGTALSDLGGGSTSVAGSNITSQTTTNVSAVSPSSNTITISQDWLAGPTTGLYVSSVPVGTYTVLPTVTVPGGFSNALSGLTVSTIDAGNSYFFSQMTHSAKAVVYISTSNTPYTTKAAMESGAVWSGYKIFNNTQFGGNFGTEFYLPSNQASSGTSTHQINVVGTWSNTAVNTYYIHTALMDFSSTVTYVGTIDLALETDLKTPLLAASGMTISGTVSRTEMSGGGFQVVSTTSNFVKMQRYSSSQAASVVMLDVGGSIEATGNITANASDKRLKDIKGLITNPLSKLKQLNGVVFNWNEIANKYANHDMERDHVGLIAQDVQKVLPEVVTTSAIGKNEGKEYLTIWYDKLIPLLVESIKELSEKVEKLEEKNKELENGN